MIPIRSTIKTDLLPCANYILIAVNILVFAYTSTLAGEPLENFYRLYGVVPGEIAFGTYGFAERIGKCFTSMFVHEGWLHIAGNLAFLYIFGDAVEDMLGHVKYLLFYLISGLVAVFVHAALDPLSTVPIIGASGAVSGVLGIYMLFFPKSKILTLFVALVFVRFVRIRAYLFVLLWFAVQFLTAIGYIGDLERNAVWAHAAGFSYGVAAGICFLYTKGYRKKKHRAGYGTGWYGEEE